MGFLIRPADMVAREVGVNLRGGDISVPQELLDGPQVGAPAQHVSGEAVPQGMGRNIYIQPGVPGMAF